MLNAVLCRPQTILVDRICAFSCLLFDTDVRDLPDAVDSFWISYGGHAQSQESGSPPPETKAFLRSLCSALTMEFPDLSPACVVRTILSNADSTNLRQVTDTRELIESLIKLHDGDGDPLRRGCSCQALAKDRRLWAYKRNNFHLKLRTRTGREGLCSAATQEGDFIALLPKLGSPVMLRPQGAFHQFVGGCYLTTTEIDQITSGKDVVMIEIR